MSNDKPAHKSSDGREREDAFAELSRAGYQGVPGGDGEHAERMARMRARLTQPTIATEAPAPEAKVVRLAPRSRVSTWWAAAASAAILIAAAVYQFGGDNVDALPEVAVVLEERALPEQDGVAFEESKKELEGPNLAPPVARPSADYGPGNPGGADARRRAPERETGAEPSPALEAYTSVPQADAASSNRAAQTQQTPETLSPEIAGEALSGDAEALAKKAPARIAVEAREAPRTSRAREAQPSDEGAVVAETRAETIADASTETGDFADVAAADSSLPATPPAVVAAAPAAPARAQSYTLSRGALSELRRITGLIADDRGTPQEGAVLEVEGTGQRYVVGEDGRFDISVPPSGRVALVTVPDSDDSLYVDISRGERYDFAWPKKPSPDEVPEARGGGHTTILATLPARAPRNEAFEAYVQGLNAQLPSPVELIFGVNRKGKVTNVRLGPTYDVDRATYKRARTILEEGPLWGERWRRGQWRVVVQ